MRKGTGGLKMDKQALIFKAALRVIKDNGFHKARMADIAREAGISYGLVYHYFGTKEDLFDAILNRWWDGLFGLMAELRQSKEEVPKKLRRLIHYFLDTYQGQPELVNIFITEISRSTTNLSTKRLDHFKKFMSLTEELISKGQEIGFLRRDTKSRYLTYIFLGALETFVSVMVLADQPFSDEAQKMRIAESILEVFLNGAKRQV
jgi:TetR/AcrR family fatty acid metabolism transcriptional regulator